MCKHEESYENCDFCKRTWGEVALVDPSHVLTTCVVKPDLVAIQTSFVCHDCVSKGLPRAVKTFCGWVKEEYDVAHVDPVVMPVEGMEGTLEEIALEMREFHENRCGIKQPVQSRHESCETEQDHVWYLPKTSLVGFLL